MVVSTMNDRPPQWLRRSTVLVGGLPGEVGKTESVSGQNKCWTAAISSLGLGRIVGGG